MATAAKLHRTMPRPTPPDEATNASVRPPSGGDADRSHKSRFRASLAWALDEYSETLAKLAK